MPTGFEPPRVQLLQGTEPRPFWSVMIPSYNPHSDYLEQTLRSVLAQDPGEEQMQIEVIDDCSPNGAPNELIQRIARGRVTVHREPENNGLARIWNRCIERARGQWVHILHQDDVVVHGFYKKLRAGIESGNPGAAFSRHAYIDPDGHWQGLSQLLRSSAGLLQNWHERIAVCQLIQCPAIVVRRSVYEEVGGFLPQLCYALDWEMWQRISVRHEVWFEPEILACYRIHGTSATSKLMLEAADIRDNRAAIHLASAFHGASRAKALAKEASANSARFALENARHLIQSGHIFPAWRQAKEALVTSQRPSVLLKTANLMLFQGRMAAVKLKGRMRTSGAS